MCQDVVFHAYFKVTRLRLWINAKTQFQKFSMPFSFCKFFQVNVPNMNILSHKKTTAHKESFSLLLQIANGNIK